jgi:hypothetical protein
MCKVLPVPWYIVLQNVKNSLRRVAFRHMWKAVCRKYFLFISKVSLALRMVGFALSTGHEDP